MANVGLYYPYIQFKDEAWLKLTALYWDQMARIVPNNFPLEDSPGVQLLKKEEVGFVFQRAPSEDEMKAVSEKFLRLIERHGDQLIQRYGVELRHGDEKRNLKPWPEDQITVATEPFGDRRLAYVYPTKMDSKLATALTEAKLAEYGPSHPDVGLGLHPLVADVYMLALARSAARNSGYEPVTDETRHHIGITACTMPQLFDALLGQVQVAAPAANWAAEAEAILVNLAFRAVLPADLKNVPMEKIVSVRQEWAEDRTRFQEGIKEIVKGLGDHVNVPDAEAFQRHVTHAFETKVRGPLEGLRRRLDQANVRTAIGAFSLATSVPAGTVIATLTGAVAAPIVGTLAALGLGIYGLITANKDKKEKLMKSSAAYLVRLENDLQPSRLGEWIENDMSHFQFVPMI